MTQPAHLNRGKREVTVAAMQFACSWDIDANIATAERLVREAAKRGAQIILIQELFETPYFCIEQDSRHLRAATTVAENRAIRHFTPIARELGVVLPISFFEKANNSYFNSIAILDAVFQLTEDEPEEITRRMRTLWIMKKATQPLSFQSAGCIFKNPRGLSAGALIEQAGLKGTKIGQAAISDRHANFIVTEEGATFEDVHRLINLAKSRVTEQFGVELELEIQVW